MPLSPRIRVCVVSSGLFQPSQASAIGANLKYSDYSEGSELKRKEAQEEEKDEALGSSLLSLLLLPPFSPIPSPLLPSPLLSS